MKHLIPKLFLILFFTGGLMGVYASAIEPFTLKITEYTVRTPKWTHDTPLKIALLSDPHVIWPSTTPEHVARIVARANALKPDVILLLGDYVGTHPFGIQVKPEDGIAPLTKLSAPCGVYAVLGNHDLHKYPKGWPEAIRKSPIPVLENRALPVKCKDLSFWVAGLAERWTQHADIPETLAQVTDTNPVILMTHNPDPFADSPDSVALMVAGHTHGGQIVLPFFGMVPAVVPSQYGLRYAYGHVTEGEKDLVVTSGLGMTGLPLRLLRPPEIALVTLERE